jgi:hypothetical protein
MRFREKYTLKKRNLPSGNSVYYYRVYDETGKVEFSTGGFHHHGC